MALGVIQSSTQHQLDRAQAENRSVAAVLSAPDARLAVHRTTAGGVATVVASPSRHALIISTAGLPALSGGQVYELWFLSGQTARRAGLLPGAGGRAYRPAAGVRPRRGGCGRPDRGAGRRHQPPHDQANRGRAPLS